MDQQVNKQAATDKKSGQKSGLMDKVGDALEKVGEKISDAGAKGIGQKIHDIGDKMEKTHKDSGHPEKV